MSPMVLSAAGSAAMEVARTVETEWKAVLMICGLLGMQVLGDDWIVSIGLCVAITAVFLFVEFTANITRKLHTRTGARDWRCATGSEHSADLNGVEETRMETFELINVSVENQNGTDLSVAERSDADAQAVVGFAPERPLRGWRECASAWACEIARCSVLCLSSYTLAMVSRGIPGLGSAVYYCPVGYAAFLVMLGGAVHFKAPTSVTAFLRPASLLSGVFGLALWSVCGAPAVESAYGLEVLQTHRIALSAAALVIYMHSSGLSTRVQPTNRGVAVILAKCFLGIQVALRMGRSVNVIGLLDIQAQPSVGAVVARVLCAFALVADAGVLAVEMRGARLSVCGQTAGMAGWALAVLPSVLAAAVPSLLEMSCAQWNALGSGIAVVGGVLVPASVLVSLASLIKRGEATGRSHRWRQMIGKAFTVLLLSQAFTAPYQLHAAAGYIEGVSTKITAMKGTVPDYTVRYSNDSAIDGLHGGIVVSSDSFEKQCTALRNRRNKKTVVPSNDFCVKKKVVPPQPDSTCIPKPPRALLEQCLLVRSSKRQYTALFNRVPKGVWVVPVWEEPKRNGTTKTPYASSKPYQAAGFTDIAYSVQKYGEIFNSEDGMSCKHWYEGNDLHLTVQIDSCNSLDLIIRLTSDMLPAYFDSFLTSQPVSSTPSAILRTTDSTDKPYCENPMDSLRNSCVLIKKDDKHVDVITLAEDNRTWQMYKFKHDGETGMWKQLACPNLTGDESKEKEMRAFIQREIIHAFSDRLVEISNHIGTGSGCDLVSRENNVLSMRLKLNNEELFLVAEACPTDEPVTTKDNPASTATSVLLFKRVSL